MKRVRSPFARSSGVHRRRVQRMVEAQAAGLTNYTVETIEARRMSIDAHGQIRHHGYRTVGVDVHCGHAESVVEFRRVNGKVERTRRCETCERVAWHADFEEVE